MLAEPNETTVKLNMTHNISSAVMMEIRFDLYQTIGSVKQQAHQRYGSIPSHVELLLKDKSGNVIHHLDNDHQQLAMYAPQDGYCIHVIDNNPDSVLKGLEDTSQVQKFELSEEKYDALPDNFRKFKQKYLQSQAAGNEKNVVTIDEEYMKVEALQLSVGFRCKLLNGDYRGTIKYVGSVPQMGLGYFVGIQLDLPKGSSNGSVGGFSYFSCQYKYGLFVRPNEIEMGDFPPLDSDDEI